MPAASNRWQHKQMGAKIQSGHAGEEFGDASPRDPERTAMRLFVSAGAGLVGLVMLPFLVVALIILEHLVFGSRHFSNGLEAIGLTRVLQAIFDALGMNG